MASFSNSTEGDVYQEKYCYNCANWTDRISSIPLSEGYESCPIWDLHWLYAAQRGGKTKLGQTIKAFLDELIPMQTDGIFAAECSMFIDKRNIDNAEDKYLQQLREGKAPVFGIIE